MMMKMLRRRAVAEKLCAGLRCFYKQSDSFSRRNFSNKYKNLMKGSDSDPPLLLNCGNGYFHMLTSSFFRERKVHHYKKDVFFCESVEFPYKNFVVSGPCNGLFCIYSVDGQIALWNPGTGDLKNLSIEEKVPADQEIVIHNLGFGFDTNQNDYKMVRSITRRFVNPYYKSVDQVIHQIEIYSLKTKQWREIPVLGGMRSYLPHIFSPASFADGACYWTVPWAEDDEFKRLISFDFREEEFHLHYLPQRANYGYSSFGTFNFNGWPAVFGCTDPVPTKTDIYSVLHIHIWMRMPVNGVKTWDNEMEVGEFSCYHPTDAPVRPLCLWKNQVLVLSNYHDDKLVYCDFQTNKHSELDFSPEYCFFPPQTLQTIKDPPVQVLNFPESFVPNPW